MMAVVAEGERRRIYIPASPDQIKAARVARPADVPDEPLPVNPRDFKTPNYGLATFADLFTSRQLVALTTLTALVREARDLVKRDAHDAGLSSEDADLYANAVALYLGQGASRIADRHSAVGGWDSSPTKEQVRGVFARQAIPMVWDFAEANPFCRSSGNVAETFEWIAKVVERLPAPKAHPGIVQQRDAQVADLRGCVISTDPPYYDNIGYADLSDYFYVWLRRALSDFYTDVTGTMLTPKVEELVATPYRFEGSKAAAEESPAHFFGELELEDKRGQLLF